MTLPAYLADKNTLGHSYKMLVEFRYDGTDPNPANWLYYRKARYSQDLVVTIDQLGNPSVDVTVTFAGGKPIGDLEEQQDMPTAASQMQIVLPNSSREIQSICEFYDLSEQPGRVLWVNPQHLSDGVVVESVFQIEMIAPVRDHAVMSVTPYSFNPLTKMIPAETISSQKWPGVAGVRARFLV